MPRAVFAKVLCRLCGLFVRGIEPLFPVRDRVSGLLLKLFDARENFTHLPLGHVAILALLKEASNERSVLLTQRLVGLGETPLNLGDALLVLPLVARQNFFEFVDLHVILLGGLGDREPTVGDRGGGLHQLLPRSLRLHGVDLLTRHPGWKAESFADALHRLAALEEGPDGMLPAFFGSRGGAA